MKNGDIYKHKRLPVIIRVSEVENGIVYFYIIHSETDWIQRSSEILRIREESFLEEFETNRALQKQWENVVVFTTEETRRKSIFEKKEPN